MATECWAHRAWTGCGGKAFPPLRRWASCWVPELQGPSPCGPWSAWGMDWRSLSSAGRKERQVSPAAQCGFSNQEVPGQWPQCRFLGPTPEILIGSLQGEPSNLHLYQANQVCLPWFLPLPGIHTFVSSPLQCGWDLWLHSQPTEYDTGD